MEQKQVNDNIGTLILVPIVFVLFLFLFAIYFGGASQAESRILESCAKHKMYIVGETMMTCEIKR